MRDADDDRPDPDALLERVNAEETDKARAKLRLFVGASPGVGKTYTMLENAQRERADGVDVQVGVVETHGRKETAALLRGLPHVPRRQVSYRGRTLEEFDLDATLSRRPSIVLLDELAHTNAPGSRHQKRWQDAMELLEAGIEVHSTLNVQHVESLNDVVAQITHVRVRETVPDAVIERADQIELIDVPPEVVLERLAEGKVYVSEQAERAAAGFFKVGNLHALRELALRLIAEHVDDDVQQWRRQQGIEVPWHTSDRLLVCIGPSPGSARLVRAARRIASALHCPWIAAYVERPAGPPLSDADRTRLAGHLRLAESLGGEVVVLSGERAADALLDLAKRREITRMVCGKPTHARWRDVLFGSLVDDLVRRSGDIDVHVIAGEPERADAEAARAPAPPLPLTHYAQGLALVAIAALIANGVGDLVGLPDIAMLFLVAITITAAFLGRGPSMLASVVAVAVFDFLFVPPRGSFAVSDLRHLLTFVVMLGAGLLISSLTHRIRRQSLAARERERRTASLYSLTRALSSARDHVAIARVAAEQIREVFESSATLLVASEDAADPLVAPAPDDPQLSEMDRTVARWVFEHGRPAGRGLDTLHGARVIGVPIVTENRTVGVLVVVPSPESRFEDPLQRHQLTTFVSQIGLALERTLLADDATKAKLRAETEEMRSSLLSSVSHDLRTPIATVLGTATMLLERRGPMSDEQLEMVTMVRDETTRLSRLVANLLDITRVESRGLEVKKEWVPLEEVLGVVLNRYDARLKGRELKVDVPGEVVAHIDPVLFEQVLVNLVENALRHTPDGTPIEIRAWTRDDEVRLEVADRGPGIPGGAETRIFEKFARGGSTNVGVGLGLAICKGIVQAHGGSITASNRDGGGASFLVTLPLDGTPPRLPAESEIAEAVS